MNILKKLRPETLRAKSTLAIIVTVAVLIEIISATQYWYARKGIREEVEHRAAGSSLTSTTLARR